MKTLLRQHEEVMLAAQVEAVRVAASFGIATPLEVAPRAWREACAQAEARRGVKLIKYFNSTREGE